MSATHVNAKQDSFAFKNIRTARFLSHDLKNEKPANIIIANTGK